MRRHLRVWAVILLAGAAFLLSVAAPVAAASEGTDVPGGFHADLRAFFIETGTGTGILEIPVLAPAAGSGIPDRLATFASALDRGCRIVLQLVSMVNIKAPVPGAALLLGAGILCLIGFWRRERPQA